MCAGLKVKLGRYPGSILALKLGAYVLPGVSVAAGVRLG